MRGAHLIGRAPMMPSSSHDHLTSKLNYRRFPSYLFLYFLFISYLRPAIHYPVCRTGIPDTGRAYTLYGIPDKSISYYQLIIYYVGNELT